MEENADWRGEVKKQLESGEGMIGLRELAQYFTNQGNLYFRNAGGWLSRCVGPEEAERRLKKTHEKHWEITEIPLYRRIQREGYFWPRIKKDVAELQRKCDKCQLFFHVISLCYNCLRML